MPTLVRLRILDVEDERYAYSFSVQFLSEEGVVLDLDRFRWAKQTAMVVPAPVARLQDGIPPGTVLVRREVNRFDYESLARIATRHFLRRQGVAPRSPIAIDKPAGPDVRRLGLAARHAAMKGATLAVDLGFDAPLRPLSAPSGTVLTISDDYDVMINADLTLRVSPTTILQEAGHPVPAGRYRSTIRFPLASLPLNASVQNVDMTLFVIQKMFSPRTGRIQAYNQDGQADPEADSNADMYTRIKDDASPYLSGFTDWRTASSAFLPVTHELPAAANSDLEAAKAAVDRFSLGYSYNEDETTFNENMWLSGLLSEPVQPASEPQLIITYSRPAHLIGVHGRDDSVIRLRGRDDSTLRLRGRDDSTIRLRGRVDV